MWCRFCDKISNNRSSLSNTTVCNWCYAQYTPPTPRLSSWVELSCVGGVYTPVGCRDPVYNNSATNGVGLEVAGSRLATAASWLRSHRRHDATRLRCRQTVYTRRDSSRLSPIQYTPPTQRRPRCVLGFRCNNSNKEHSKKPSFCWEIALGPKIQVYGPLFS